MLNNLFSFYVKTALESFIFLSRDVPEYHFKYHLPLY